MHGPPAFIARLRAGSLEEDEDSMRRVGILEGGGGRGKGKGERVGGRGKGGGGVDNGRHGVNWYDDDD